MANQYIVIVTYVKMHHDERTYFNLDDIVFNSDDDFQWVHCDIKTECLGPFESQEIAEDFKEKILDGQKYDQEELHYVQVDVREIKSPPNIDNFNNSLDIFINDFGYEDNDDDSTDSDSSSNNNTDNIVNKWENLVTKAIFNCD